MVFVTSRSIRVARHRGFTLLEVLVALAIFAIIGLGCWQVLDRVITSRQLLENRSAELRQLQKAIWVISRDIQNLADRPVRDAFGESLPAITSLLPGRVISLTRQGWSNPLYENRSTLQRVAYAVEVNQEGQKSLVRYYWRALDQAPQTEPHKQTLFHDVNHFEVQFIDAEGNYQFHWPGATLPTAPQDSGNQTESAPMPTLPAGVLIRLDVQPFGEIERVYALRQTGVAS